MTSLPQQLIVLYQHSLSDNNKDHIQKETNLSSQPKVTPHTRTDKVGVAVFFISRGLVLIIYRVFQFLGKDIWGQQLFS